MLLPGGDFDGAAWSRAGRALTTDTDGAQIPLRGSQPIALDPNGGREVFLRQSGVAGVTTRGVIVMQAIPMGPDDDLDDPYLLSALSIAYGGLHPAPIVPAAGVSGATTATARSATIGAATGTISFTAGTLYADIQNDPQNTLNNALLIGATIAGSLFRLPTGAAFNAWVGPQVTWANGTGGVDVIRYVEFS